MELTRKHYIIGGLVAVLLVILMVVGVSALAGRVDDSPMVEGEVTVPTDLPTPPPDPTSTDLPTPSAWPVEPKPTPEEVRLGDGTFPDPADVDRGDPDDVAKTFAALTASWDTTVDSSETDALTRAMPLAAPEFVTPPAPTGGAGAEWLEASACEAYSSVNAELTPNHVEGGEGLVFEPTGEPITPYTIKVTHNWQCRVADGEGNLSAVLVPQFRTVFLSLVERDGEWSVVDYGYALAAPEQIDPADLG